MTDLENLDIGELSDITSSSKKQFKDKVEDKDLTINDIEALKEAEKSGKNRRRLLEFLNDLKTKMRVEENLKVAQKSSDELETVIDNIENIEDVEHLEENNIKLQQDRLIELVGGTVKDMRKFVEENPLTREQLKDILNAERKVKNRKTAKSFLESKIKKQKIGEDVEKAKNELKHLEEDVKEIEEDESLETEDIEDNLDEITEIKGGEDQPKESENDEVEDELEDTEDELQGMIEGMKKNSEPEETDDPSEDIGENERESEGKNDKKEANKSEGKDRGEKNSNKETGRKADKTLKDRRQNETKEKKKALNEIGDSIGNSDVNSPDIDEEKLAKAIKNLENEEENKDSSNNDEGADKNGGEEKKDSTEKKEEDEPEDTEDEGPAGNNPDKEDLLERKKDLREELRIDVSDDELEELSIDELENLADEKTHREELISEIVKEDGMNPEELKKASTKDLEKLTKNSINTSNEDSEEMRREAEEDLEMLMGAVRKETDEDADQEDEEGIKDRVEDLRSQIEELIHRGGEKNGDAEDIRSEEVKELLRDYRSLSREEAAIKTAHVMKGFLEQKLGINRELTYKELAEKMPKKDKEMEKLSDFFLKMHREQYTGKIEISSTQTFMKICKNALDNF